MNDDDVFTTKAYMVRPVLQEPVLLIGKQR